MGVQPAARTDPESPLTILASGPAHEGFLVIDSVYHNTSSGGVRIAPDLAVEEIRDLAREMTLKYALFRLPRGGAKAGLRLAAGLESDARRDALVAFGRQIGPIIRAGLYNPGMDMNCGPVELEAIYRGAGISIGPPTDTSFFTSISVANALQGCAETLGGTGPLTVAIEGFGRVGGYLATMLPPSQFRIIAISTVVGAVVNVEGFSPQELQRKRGSFGDDLVGNLPGTPVPHEDILTLSVDLLVPAARTGGITEAVVRRIRSRAVVPVANAPYRPGTAALLHERGVLCLPGYLCNGGGVFGSSLADSGVPIRDIEAMFRIRYRHAVGTLLQRCLRDGVSPVSVVDALALREVERRRGEIPSASLFHKVLERGARRFPAAVRRRVQWRGGSRVFDAMESGFSGADG